jgi:DHA2 family multidrug resistance protein
MVARQAMVLSYIDNFRMLAFLCFLCVPAVFLFKRVRAKKGPVAMH